MFIREEQIRFRHCDPAGIVFYPRYFEMVNDLVEDWFNELGMPFSEMHKSHGVPTVEVSGKFLKPGRQNDLMKKRLRVSKIGNSSVTLEYDFINERGETLFQGKAVLVFVELNEGQLKSVPWTEELLSKMKKYSR